MTGFLAYSIWLSLVLSHASVHCPELSSISSFGVLDQAKCLTERCLVELVL